jgi:hypothetical protein
MRITLLTVLIVAASCNPYDPDLGEGPFRCGTDEPRCPAGYGPVEESATRCTCQEGAAGGGGAEFTCNEDPNEGEDGNESVSDATPTPIGDGPSSWQQADIAVCAVGDVDVFSLQATNGQTITATLIFPPAQGRLTLDLLNSGDQSLAQGELSGSTMTATLVVPATGDYFAKVAGEDGETRNNYTLRLAIANP